MELLDGSWRRPTTLRFRIRLWCEAEGCQHPVLESGQGTYEFSITRDWVCRVAPYANFIASLLKIILPVSAPAANVMFGSDIIKTLGIQDHIDLMKEMTRELLTNELRIEEPPTRRGILSQAERSGVLALHAQINKIDPHHEKLGLRRIPTYTGEYLWLCDKHYLLSRPRVPDSHLFDE